MESRIVESKADRSFVGRTGALNVPPGNYSGILRDAVGAENRFKDLSTYLQGIKVPWVFSGISVIAYNYAKGPWHVMDGDAEVDDPKDPLLRLWNKPNKRTRGFQFRELSQFYNYLCGEYFITLENWTIDERPTEMYLPIPARMRVVQDSFGEVSGYVYDPSGTGNFSNVGGLIPYEPWEVVHVKMSNPLDPLRGMGIMEAGDSLMNTIAAMTNTELSYWQSGGRIIGVLQTDNPVDDETFKKLVQRWREFTAQKQQRFKTAILEQGLKYQPIAEGLKGLDMTALDKGKRDQVLAMLGVPKNKLGIIEDAAYKSDEADMFFWGETMEPLFTRNEEGLAPLAEIFNPDYLIVAERKTFEDDTVKLNNAKIMQALGFTVGETMVYLGVEEPDDKRKDMVILSAGTVAVPVDQLGDPPAPPPGGGGGAAAVGAPNANSNGSPSSAATAGQKPLAGVQASATGTQNGRSNQVDATGHKPNDPKSVVKSILESADIKMIAGLDPVERKQLVEHYADMIEGARAVIKSRRRVERKGLAKLGYELKERKVPRLPHPRPAATMIGAGELVRRGSESTRARLVTKHKPLIAAAMRTQRRRLTPVLKEFIETFKDDVNKKEPSLRSRQLEWLRAHWPGGPLAAAVVDLHVEAANDGWRLGKRSLGF